MLPQQNTQENPFGFSFGTTDIAESAINSMESVASTVEQVVSPAEDMMEYLTHIETDKIASAVAGKVNELVSYVSSGISAVADMLFSIVKQAVKMAAFKFAIEMCAMAIKSLVEAMLSLKLTPPNIDTKGVYYNIPGASTATVTSSPSAGSRYDNPFTNPFGGMPGTTW